MIKINPQDYERIYRLLTSTPLSKNNNLPGDEWKSEQVGNETIDRRALVLVNDHIELIHPLLAVTQSYFVRGQKYYSLMEIFKTPELDFKDYQDKFSDNLREKNYVFYPTSGNLTGYIFKKEYKDQEPLAVIASSDEDESRIIASGTYGAKNLTLNCSKDFSLEMGLLNIYTNLFLKSIYQDSIYTQMNGRQIDIRLSFPPI